jgi:hypothetical protein
MQLDPHLRPAYFCSTKCRDAVKENNFTVPKLIVGIHGTEISGNVFVLQDLMKRN